MSKPAQTERLFRLSSVGLTPKLRPWQLFERVRETCRKKKDVGEEKLHAAGMANAPAGSPQRLGGGLIPCPLDIEPLCNAASINIFTGRYSSTSAAEEQLISNKQSASRLFHASVTPVMADREVEVFYQSSRYMSYFRSNDRTARETAGNSPQLAAPRCIATTAEPPFLRL